LEYVWKTVKKARFSNYESFPKQISRMNYPSFTP